METQDAGDHQQIGRDSEELPKLEPTDTLEAEGKDRDTENVPGSLTLVTAKINIPESSDPPLNSPSETKLEPTEEDEGDANPEDLAEYKSSLRPAPPEHPLRQSNKFAFPCPVFLQKVGKSEVALTQGTGAVDVKCFAACPFVALDNLCWIW